MRISGLSFSLKRALGISGLKAKIDRKTGIPTTKQGLERKIGATIIKAVTKKNKCKIKPDPTRLRDKVWLLSLVSKHQSSSTKRSASGISTLTCRKASIKTAPKAPIVRAMARA